MFNYNIEYDSNKGRILMSQSKKLKRGEIQFEKTLDLHGYNIVSAKIAVSYFIESSYNARVRCVRIITGNGIIKTLINEWLNSELLALSWCTAKPCHGGDGALYVLIKKKKDM
jgi:DNA-nicking Smr family endonuclease